MIALVDVDRIFIETVDDAFCLQSWSSLREILSLSLLRGVGKEKGVGSLRLAASLRRVD